MDSGLLNFQNLKELVLSANRLKSINPGNLPKKLEVCEKFALLLFTKYFITTDHFSHFANLIQKHTA